MTTAKVGDEAYHEVCDRVEALLDSVLDQLDAGTFDQGKTEAALREANEILRGYLGVAA